MRDAYTLEFPIAGTTNITSDTAPEVLLVCSVLYALSVSAVHELVFASVLPLLCLMKRNISIKALVKLNIINIIMIITLGLTWPVFTEGIMTGILIALRVNMIYIVFASLVFPLGMAKIYSALCTMGMPEKLRVLLLLTLRGIYILYERLDAALVSVKLRAPALKGTMKLKVIAYVFASVLLQGSDRSERMMQAVECRGGFGGFMQAEHKGLSRKDIMLCAVMIVYAAMIIAVNYAGS